jgi:hypothetical protein
MPLWASFASASFSGPIALVKAGKAKKMIEMNPRLTGSGKVTAAYIIGIIDVISFVVTVYANVARMHH